MRRLRSIQLPDRRLRTRELEKIQEAIASEQLDVDQAFSSLVTSYLRHFEECARDGFVVHAYTHDMNASPHVIVGLSFVPTDSNASEAVAVGLRAELLSAGLSRLVSVIISNELSVDSRKHSV